MTRLRRWIALPALLVATSGPALAFDIRDKAGMFSAEAVRKADSELDRISAEYKVPVTIETIDTLGGDPINAVLKREAKKLDARGLYVLIAKKEHKIQAEVSTLYAKHLGGAREESVYKSFEPDFKKGNFDEGLMAGVSRIDSVFSEARAEAGGSLRANTPATNRAGARPAPGGGAAVPNKPSMGAGSLIWIVLGILGVLILFRIIGALFSAGRGGYANQNQMMGRGPGYGGGGGYGGAPGGGGGFMSSMFGGIGGALAGNWLYDQFSGGRNHGATYDQNAANPGVTDAPADPGGTDWVAPNETGGDWGGGGGDAGGNWGGDAGGGGGGGDWGGGGGGGDWGGGGDAGGGDGGSW